MSGVSIDAIPSWNAVESIQAVGIYTWNSGALAWQKQAPISAGGGGAVTIADGADVAQGTTTDTAWVSGAGTVISLLKKIASAGGSAVSVADGADIAEGATTDTAVTGDTSGTVSGKLRGLVKILTDIWDSVNHRIKVDGSGVTQPVSGTITSNQGTANTVANAWPVKLTDGTDTALIDATGEQLIDINRVSGATLPVKGTQAANFVPVQQAHNTGRTYIIFYVDRIAGVTTEALVTMTINKGGSTTTGTSYTVTTGKTLRLINLETEVLNTTTTANRVISRVRSAATVAVTSPIVAMGLAAAQVALAASGGTDSNPLTEGIEIAAGQQIGISQLCSVTTAGIVSICLQGYEY